MADEPMPTQPAQPAADGKHPLSSKTTLLALALMVVPTLIPDLYTWIVGMIPDQWKPAAIAVIGLAFLILRTVTKGAIDWTKLIPSGGGTTTMFLLALFGAPVLVLLLIARLTA